MRAGLGLAQEQALARPALDTPAKEIPYDYVAKFKLQGQPGNRVQDVINISTDGEFIAVAIGYSFIRPRLPPLSAPAPIERLPARPTDGIGWLIDNLLLSVMDDPRALAQSLAARLCGIEFKYSIVDSGTGRELQNQPIHNLAGLGESSGERPFRPFAKPMLFQPRSTIRIEIEEISPGTLYAGAELYIVLHGYKALR